jgi:septum formation protein
MIILASTSPTRQTILANAGVTFATASPQVDERALVAQNPQWQPENIAEKLAEAKALDVSRRQPHVLVIGADQVLAMGSQIYSKPKDLDDCRRQLLELRGASHRLISSVTCARDGKRVWSFTGTTELAMRDFSDAFLDTYLAANGENCMKSVGGYQIEGLGLQLFASINGDYFTILGLPLLPLLDYLRSVSELPS